MIKKIAITGPESTGKSSLAIALAKHFNTVFVPEYAREYINSLNHPYNFDDILKIARNQKRLEDEYSEKADKILFCDTDLTVTKIWCEFKFNKCHKWIIENHKKQDYDIYLLCDIDLPWVSDPMREHPDKRKELFDFYENELKINNFNYKIISGKNEIRLNNAIEIIKNYSNSI